MATQRKNTEQISKEGAEDQENSVRVTVIKKMTSHAGVMKMLDYLSDNTLLCKEVMISV